MDKKLREELENILNEVDPSLFFSLPLGVAGGYALGRKAKKVYCKKKFGHNTKEYKKCVEPKIVIGKKEKGASTQKSEQIHQPVGKGYDKNIMQSFHTPRTSRDIDVLKKRAEKRVKRKLYGRKRGRAKPIRAYNVRGEEKPKHTARTRQVKSQWVDPEFTKKHGDI